MRPRMPFLTVVSLIVLDAVSDEAQGSLSEALRPVLGQLPLLLGSGKERNPVKRLLSLMEIVTMDTEHRIGAISVCSELSSLLWVAFLKGQSGVFTSKACRCR